MGQLVEIRGLDKLAADCRNFTRSLNAEIRKAQTEARKRLVQRLTDYPPPPPGSRYQRTYALQRGWERAVPVLTNDGKAMQLINAITYVPYVQGDNQAWMHQGRWTKASEIVDEEQDAIVQLFEEAAERTAQGFGNG